MACTQCKTKSNSGAAIRCHQPQCTYVLCGACYAAHARSCEAASVPILPTCLRPSCTGLYFACLQPELPHLQRLRKAMSEFLWKAVCNQIVYTGHAFDGPDYGDDWKAVARLEHRYGVPQSAVVRGLTESALKAAGVKPETASC